MKNGALSQVRLECDCAGGCSILAFDRWDDETDFYADIYVIPQKATIRYRIRNAWRSLLGQPTYDPGLVLSAREAMRLCEWLGRELVDPGAPSDSAEWAYRHGGAYPSEEA